MIIPLFRILGLISRPQLLQVDLPGGDPPAKLHGLVQVEVLPAYRADHAPVPARVDRHPIGRHTGVWQPWLLPDPELHPVPAPHQVLLPLPELDRSILRHKLLLLRACPFRDLTPHFLLRRLPEAAPQPARFFLGLIVVNRPAAISILESKICSMASVASLSTSFSRHAWRSPFLYLTSRPGLML